MYSSIFKCEPSHPKQRPKSIGIFRLWRDLGYAIGAILTGLIADRLGLLAPILVMGLLTVASSLIVKFRTSCAEKKAVPPNLKFQTFTLPLIQST
jgi:predicted MFS family arabinose efflux permease